MKRQSSLLLLFLLLQLSLQELTAAGNKAAGLRWLGYVDLGMKFGDFFAKDFTLTARFMPQYKHTYRGPVLASANGTFLAGQGNYEEDVEKRGETYIQSPADKLVLVVGGHKRTYLLPQGQWEQRWYHLAVRASYKYTADLNTGTVYKQFVFDVFLDGKLLCANPVLYKGCSLAMTSLPATPAGTLRIGRTRAEQSWSDQFYGFVDDVGVFNDSLPDAQIRGLAATPQLDSGWSNLVAAYTFDFQNCSLNAIATCFFFKEDTLLSSVSLNRDSVADATHLPVPAPHWSHAATLPFKRGQAWFVNQGYDQTGSHNGNAVFSYDLILAGTPTAGKPMHPWNQPAQSCGEPLYAVNDGTVSYVVNTVNWIDTTKDPPANPNVDYDGPNRIIYQLEKHVGFSHLHVFAGSVQEAFPDRYFFPSDGTGDLYKFNIRQGEFVGRVGTRNGCHHHMSANNWDAPTGSKNGVVTIPFGFWAYEVCSANCGLEANWSMVLFGTPKHGQYIRKPL